MTDYTDTTLDNIFRVLVLGEAERLGIIDKDLYKDLLIKVLNAIYQSFDIRVKE